MRQASNAVEAVAKVQKNHSKQEIAKIILCLECFFNIGCSICCTRFYAYSEHPQGTWASSPATLGAKRRFRSEYGERKLAEMTIFADRCCPCGEVKAKKEYQEGGDLSAPYGAPLIPHLSSLLCHCRLCGIAGEDAHVPCGCSLMK